MGMEIGGSAEKRDDDTDTFRDKTTKELEPDSRAKAVLNYKGYFSNEMDEKKRGIPSDLGKQFQLASTDPTEKPL
jgi:hypothetical protein